LTGNVPTKPKVIAILEPGDYFLKVVNKGANQPCQRVMIDLSMAIYRPFLKQSGVGADAINMVDLLAGVSTYKYQPELYVHNGFTELLNEVTIFKTFGSPQSLLLQVDNSQAVDIAIQNHDSGHIYLP
jgi:hypothetical protein